MAYEEDFSMETRVAPPAHLLLKFESFSSRLGNGIRKYESTIFVAGDYKWLLTIELDGDQCEADFISAYLSMVDTSSLPADWEINAIFTIFLMNHISDAYLCFAGKVQQFCAMNLKRGFFKMISKNRLIDPCCGYIVDDNCVFGAEVFVPENPPVIETMKATQPVIEIVKATDPYKNDFMISQFSKLQGVWKSTEFIAGSQKWQIILYPNGNGKGLGKSISIFLELVGARSFGPHEKVKADFSIRIRNKLKDTHLSMNFSHLYVSSEPNWGHPKFISRADMCDPEKGFLVNDCCFLEIEIMPE